MIQVAYPGDKVKLKKPSVVRGFDFYPDQKKEIVINNQNKIFTIQEAKQVSSRTIAYTFCEVANFWFFAEAFDVIEQDPLVAKEFVSLI